MMHLIKHTFLFLLIGQFMTAQTVLTLDDAIKSALEKNFSVLISKNTQEIAKLQNNLGNAGMSPTVSISGAYNFANLNSHQEFNSGAIQDKDGAISKNLAASVNANWTIFDGLKMFAIRKRLVAAEQVNLISYKQEMENLIYQVILSYNSIVRINALIKTGQQNLLLYEERNNLAKVKYNIGSESKMDYLLAQSNERKIKSDLSQLQIQLLGAKANLNLLINKKADVDFNTIDSIVINFNPSLDELNKLAINSNKSILISKQNEIQFEQSIKEARAANIPQIQLNTSYNFTRNQNQAGIVFLNRQAGFNAGVSANWLIFNGNRNKKLVQERNILFQNQKYITEQNIQKVDSWLYLQYQTFLLNQKIMNFELENLLLATEVFTISLDRYKLGKANFYETIEMQNNLENAQSRFVNAKYNLKVAETELLKTSGSLIKLQ